VQSITRAVEIIKCLSAGDDRLIDICRRLDLGKSTVHRILKTLESLGIAVQDPVNRRYNLGYLFASLASNPRITHQNLISNALEEMNHLRDLCHETISLQIRTGSLRLCLEELESPLHPKITIGKGTTLPLQSGSGGKVMLSQLSRDELRSLMKYLKLDAVSDPRSSQATFIKGLDKVKSQGYAFNINDSRGCASISVPIRNYVCQVALTMLGPKSHSKGMMTILPEMKDSAERISHRLLGLQ
jgi:IclR family KDG regulon transcriptional repressor